MKTQVRIGACDDILEGCPGFIQWGLFECEYSTDGGNTWHVGFIESDAYNNYAIESLTDENGDPV